MDKWIRESKKREKGKKTGWTHYWNIKMRKKKIWKKKVE